MIVSIILIGIVVSIGGILATTMTDIVQTGLVLDAVEVKRLAIQNTGTQSYITGMVKNAGNTDIEDVTIIVTTGTAVTTSTGTSVTDSDGVFVVKFTPNNINSGVSATVNGAILSDTATAGDVSLTRSGTTPLGTSRDSGATVDEIRLGIGEEYLVEIRALIAGGGEHSQTKILSPQ